MENTSTSEKHNFAIGDIVALSSHPFSGFQHDILIGGEPQLISPLMIIVEILGDSQNLYDENVGNQIQVKGGSTAQCKCIWYSSKSFQFEEAWVSSKLLKKINYKNNSISNEKDEQGKSKHIQVGTLVTLCTAQLELKKLKSSYKSEGGKERSSINPLLSFVSPIMQIIGTAKNESKEPLYDSKTGNKKKEISELLIKCKWFNPSSEKFSEKLIPIEALTLIPQVDEEKLKEIATFIKKGVPIVIKFNGKETIFMPAKIIYTHGFYKLSGYDYLSNTVKEFLIDDKLILDKKDENVFINKVPNFVDAKLKNEKYLSQLETVIKDAITENNYVRIKYKDRNNNVTLRTIKNFKTEPENEVIYLIGHCILRNAERNFHIDRIQFLEVLNLKY
jgi:DNA-binding Xre family transcriptional regulator